MRAPDIKHNKIQAVAIIVENKDDFMQVWFVSGTSEQKISLL